MDKENIKLQKEEEAAITCRGIGKPTSNMGEKTKVKFIQPKGIFDKLHLRKPADYMD